jgi:succinoglycan biosynthesis transport protein ExoP
VLLAAAHAAEGCSTIGAQLVRYATSTGAKAVLVDADLRSRGMTQALGVEAKVTFADGTLSEAKAKSAVVHLKDRGMHICPAPDRSGLRPLDVLGSRKMQSFFDTLRDEYDLIVIDTPPMAAYVDASALAEYADCAIIVVKARHTQQDDVLDMLERLDPEQRLAVGIVLNMADRPAKD